MCVTHFYLVAHSRNNFFRCSFILYFWHNKTRKNREINNEKRWRERCLKLFIVFCSEVPVGICLIDGSGNGFSFVPEETNESWIAKENIACFLLVLCFLTIFKSKSFLFNFKPFFYSLNFFPKGNIRKLRHLLNWETQRFLCVSVTIFTNAF